MLGEIWSAAVWLSTTVVLVSVVLVAWAWNRSRARTESSRHAVPDGIPVPAPRAGRPARTGPRVRSAVGASRSALLPADALIP